MTLAKAKRKQSKRRKQRKPKTRKICSIRMSLLSNTSSCFTEQEFWDAVRFVIEPMRPRIKQHPELELKLQNSSDLFDGVYYPTGSLRAENLAYTYKDEEGVTCNVFRRSTPYVRVQVTPDDGKFPYYVERRSGTGYQSMLLLSKHETLVMVLAHELRHVWQEENKGKRRGKFWGERGAYSDKGADAWAKRMVRRYRRLHYYNHKEAYLPLFFVVIIMIINHF